MHPSVHIAETQLQNDGIIEVGELTWPTYPTCRFSTHGGPYVLRQKCGGAPGGDSKHIIVRLKCKCWHCPECRVNRAKAWRTRLSAYMTTAFVEGRVPFVMSVEVPNWGTVSKRLQRAGAYYCTVETGGGLFVIGAAVADQIPKDAMTVDEEEAFRSLDKYILEVAGRGFKDGQRNRPITACKAWKAPKEEKEYAMVGPAPTKNPVELRSLLGNNHIPCKTIKTEEGWVIRFRATPEALSAAFYNSEVNIRREAGTSPLSEGKSALNGVGFGSKEAEKASDVPTSSGFAYETQEPRRLTGLPMPIRRHPTGSGISLAFCRTSWVSG